MAFGGYISPNNEAPNACFFVGAGDCYFKVDNDFVYLVVAASTSMDYSCLIARSNNPIVQCEIVNRSGFDLSSYTLVRNTSFPAFYKDYATLNDLFSALGDIDRLYGETFLETDLNAAADGLREFGTDTQNSPIPDGYGMVFTSSLDWNTVRRFCRLQICVNQICSVFYFRICWNGTWSAWNNLMQ